jgi:hypothetical protein
MNAVLGNWLNTQVDTNGNGTYDSAETEGRSHDFANEHNSRTPAGSSTALAFTFDNAGNERTQATGSASGRVYTHDAWNRLVHMGYSGLGLGTAYSPDYEYNALHWRTVKRLPPTTTAGTNGELRLSQRSECLRNHEAEVGGRLSSSAFGTKTGAKCRSREFS